MTMAKTHLVLHGYVDLDTRPSAVPEVMIKATFSPSPDISARGPDDRAAMHALAAEIRRIADAIDRRADEPDAPEESPA